MYIVLVSLLLFLCGNVAATLLLRRFFMTNKIEICDLFSELSSTVTQYIFSTVIGTVDTF